MGSFTDEANEVLKWYQKLLFSGAEERAQQLIALAALSKDLVDSQHPHGGLNSL